jgi:surfactin synthase thioesterase subunit
MAVAHPGHHAERLRLTLYFRTSGNRSALRLFCFHHAGGGGSLFRGWQAALSSDIEVLPVRLPGRENRIREKRFVHMDDLLDDLLPAILPYLDRPHLFFGHSMGALIAWRLALREQQHGGLPLKALFVSACASPHRQAALSMHKLHDQELVQRLDDAGGLPRQLLEHPAWISQILPALRDDLALCASAGEREQPMLECPIHVMGGAGDRLVDSAWLHEWSGMTRIGCDVTHFPGGHFYLNDQPARIFRHMAPLLGRYSGTNQSSANNVQDDVRANTHSAG